VAFVLSKAAISGKLKAAREKAHGGLPLEACHLSLLLQKHDIEMSLIGQFALQQCVCQANSVP
jgi:hypothetical protein